MLAFGENQAVRLAFFERGFMPKPGALKKIFSTSTARTYKGWGHFNWEIRTIDHALRIAAEHRGSSHPQTLVGCEVAVLDENAQYTVFTAAKYFGSLVATINWSPVDHDRLRSLLSTFDGIHYNIHVCNEFVNKLEHLKDLFSKQGITDPQIEAFDHDAFKGSYGQLGQQGFIELGQLIADEVANLQWTAENPVYEGAANDDQEPEAKAA